MKALSIVFAVLAVVLLVIAVKVSVWQECRADGHSFLYCMHLTGG